MGMKSPNVGGSEGSPIAAGDECQGEGIGGIVVELAIEEEGEVARSGPSVGWSVAAVLAWRDLTVEVVAAGPRVAGTGRRIKCGINGGINCGINGGGASKVVLGPGVSGHACAGHVTAVMGPSGSGKSTLLRALAGRLPAAALLTAGSVRVNGLRRRRKRLAAYVAQEDDLIGTLTVWESVWFSAQLRLPDRMPGDEKRRLARAAVRDMGLDACADTSVGNWHTRGISGGERRRLSIALELLLEPQLLFLDEPTTGLDSASAFAVMSKLSDLAEAGRTIVTTIHQPSSDAFELLDALLLLAPGGQAAFFGSKEDAQDFFAAAGFPCPHRHNPADHYLQCIHSDSGKILSEHARAAESRASAPHGSGLVQETCGSRSSFKQQVLVLTIRSFTNMARDAGYYRIRFLVYVLVSLSVGSVFYNVGTSYRALLARGSCGAFVFGFMTVMSIGGFPSFVEDMKVFHKERSNGHYGALSFVVANYLSSFPFLFVISLVSATICYFMVHLHPGIEHYAFFTLALFCGVLIVEGLMMAIASIIPNFLMGIIVGAGIQAIFMLLSGFFRLPNDIPRPVWKYPLLFLSFDYWALQGQYQNDLRGMSFQDQYGENILGDDILVDMFQIDVHRSKWSDLGVVVSMTFLYRIVFFVCIKLSEETIPWIRSHLAKKALSKKQRSSAKNASPLSSAASSQHPIHQLVVM